MRWKLGAMAFAATLTVAPSAWAAEFYAHPLNPGVPTDLPGETLVPGLPETLAAVNGITQPLLQPILAPDAPGAGPAPHVVRHHHGHRAAAHAHGHRKVAAGLHRHGSHHAA